MKTFFIAIMLFLLNTAYSQKADTLFVANINRASWVTCTDKSAEYSILKFEDGTTLSVGDTIKLGEPSGFNQTTIYTPGLASSNNNTVTTFQTIMLGRLNNIASTGLNLLPSASKSRSFKIEEIKFIKAKKNSSQGTAMIVLDNPGMDITIMNILVALEYGEVVFPGAEMTSSQALAELQKAKQKLDLQVITQEEYDRVKAELIKFIK